VWVWISAATPTGTIGATRVAVDTDAPSQASWLRIHKECSSRQIDYSASITTLKAGDHIYLQAKSNYASFHRYTVTGAPTIVGTPPTTWVVPVTTASGSTPGTEPSNGADVLVVFELTAPPAVRELTGDLAAPK
jgi:hypothetical protein